MGQNRQEVMSPKKQYFSRLQSVLMAYENPVGILMVSEKQKCTHGIIKARVYSGCQKNWGILRVSEKPKCTQGIRKAVVFSVHKKPSGVGRRGTSKNDPVLHHL